MFAFALRTAQDQFTVAMPQIAAAARYYFRRWRPQDRAEAIAETQAAAWHAWHGLVARGQDPVAVGVTGIAHNACRYVRNGRRLGTGSCGRGVMDVYHRKAQAACGFTVLSLDSGDEITARPTTGSHWRQWLAADSRVGPAATAAFRLDFSAWLEELPERKRQMAELLALGHETGVVARMLGVSAGAVSQTRTWLEANWKAFQAQTDRAPERPAPAPTQGGTPRRRGRPRRTERDPAGGAARPALLGDYPTLLERAAPESETAKEELCPELTLTTAGAGQVAVRRIDWGVRTAAGSPEPDSVPFIS
jgi:hypothetical protein